MLKPCLLSQAEHEPKAAVGAQEPAEAATEDGHMLATADDGMASLEIRRKSESDLAAAVGFAPLGPRPDFRDPCFVELQARRPPGPP